MTSIINTEQEEEITAAFCALRREGLCPQPSGEGRRCAECERYNEILRRARELYRDVRWVLTPEGMLVGFRN